MRKPASREITSASEEICENEVCFLHIQLIGTNFRVRKMHRILLDVDFESSQGLLQNQSLETILICNVVLCFPHNNIDCIHMCDAAMPCKM